MPEQAKVMPEVYITMESVDVTPETTDQIACDLIAKHGPAHLKYRGTLNVFMPPYVPGVLNAPERGTEYQRNKILCGEATKLFYMTVTANY